MEQRLDKKLQNCTSTTAYFEAPKSQNRNKIIQQSAKSKSMHTNSATMDWTLRTEQLPLSIQQDRQPTVWMWTWNRDGGTFSTGMSESQGSKTGTEEKSRLWKNESSKVTWRHQNTGAHVKIHKSPKKNGSIKEDRRNLSLA